MANITIKKTSYTVSVELSNLIPIFNIMDIQYWLDYFEDMIDQSEDSATRSEWMTLANLFNWADTCNAELKEAANTSTYGNAEFTFSFETERAAEEFKNLLHVNVK